MKLRRLKYWFIAAIAFIAVSSALLFWFLQNPLVNNYHPAYETSWQAYYWGIETPFGWFGLEDWRVEGVEMQTSIDFGKFRSYGIPLSAPAVASTGFAGISTFMLLGSFNMNFLLRRWRRSN